MIGQHWIKQEGAKFSEIRLFSRRPGKDGNLTRYAWDPANGTYDPAAVDGVDYVINLAGAGIADRPWTRERKELIVQSRVDSVSTLVTALRETGVQPKLVLAASATGYYGDRGSAWVDEESDAGSAAEFLSRTTVAWEEASQQFAEAGFPTALLRIGIVLARDGGALPKLLMPLKVGVANWFGDGQQYMPWIHIADLASLMYWIIEGERTGIWNGVAPHPVTSQEMAKSLARVHGAWLTAPVPAFALRLALGEMSDTVLRGARVKTRAVHEGFVFRWPEVDAALADLRE